MSMWFFILNYVLNCFLAIDSVVGLIKPEYRF
jgi:hypothetical protein